MSDSDVDNAEYEKRRQENIARNKALLAQLQLDAAASGLGPTKTANHSQAQKRGVKRKREAPKEKKPIVPVRSSSRLKGIVADSEVAEKKAEEERQVWQAAERAKRERQTGDLKFEDMVVTGNWDASNGFSRGLRPANPGERTFDVKKTTDKELKQIREKMSSLALWEGVEPNAIKITPERIYTLGFHPTQDKALVFAGDKLGNLGIFDGSQRPAEATVEDEDGDLPGPAITTFKPHTRTISAFQFDPSNANLFVSASYDSSIRRLDLNKGVAVEVWGPEDKADDEPLSGIQMSEQHPYMVYFTSLGGKFGIYDTRTKPGEAELLQLSEKKIGGFTIHPLYPHILATASLDRFFKLWDLRKFSGRGSNKLPSLVGEHESRLSVSHASFNAAGQVATASYDDTIKIYDFADIPSWKAGHTLEPEKMEPKVQVRHNNQTGRWVTILRAHWQQQPLDGVQRFCIGNMNRFVDVYAASGQQLAQLGGEGITAVPSVAQFHPTMDWIGAGTASGKLCLWV